MHTHIFLYQNTFGILNLIQQIAITEKLSIFEPNPLEGIISTQKKPDSDKAKNQKSLVMVALQFSNHLALLQTLTIGESLG